MPSLDDMKAEFAKRYQDAKEKQEAVAANPELGKSPEMKRHFRGAGVVVFVIGIVITIGNYFGYQETGRVIVFFAATSIVFLGAGLWMMLTGKNPFRKR